jgi:hypothetical protein
VRRSSELENPNLVTGQSLNETKQDLKKTFIISNARPMSPSGME